MLNLLICKTNVLQQSFIACFVVMSIIGFVLIYIDKKRWKEQTERSIAMMEYKKKPKQEENTEGEDAENAKKDKKKKIKPSGDFEYEGRIKDRVLIGFAFFFGGLGELLAMLICRHKWYKIQYKIGMPLIALLNVIFLVLICFAAREVGESGVIIVQ